jgi:hypothetical protein
MIFKTESISILYQRLVINMSCLVNEEVLERLYEDFLEILTKDNKLPLEQREKEAALLAKEEFWNG